MSPSFEEQSTQFFKSQRKLVVAAFKTENEKICTGCGSESAQTEKVRKVNSINEHVKLGSYRRPQSPDVNGVSLQEQRPACQVSRT